MRAEFWWRGLLALVLLGAAVAAAMPGGVSAAPTLSLSPDHAPCTGTITISGTGRPANQALALTARATKPPSDNGIQFATPTIDASGGFRIDAPVSKMIPGCLGANVPPDGTVFTIYLTADPGAGTNNQGLATATFVVGTAPAAQPGLPNTGGGWARRTPPVSPLGVGLLVLLLAAGYSINWTRWQGTRSRTYRD
jgi:hypothetical protein